MSEELAWLTAMEGRLTTVLFQAAGTNAWAQIKRLRYDVRRRIAAVEADRDQWAEAECQR